MAMDFREPNEVLWRGVRPAHKGTQISKDKEVNNAIEIVHTVTAGKTFYLIFWSLSSFTDVTGICDIWVRDSGDVFMYYIVQGNVVSGAYSFGLSNMCYPPREIPNECDIVVKTNAAGLKARACIHGWEE